MYWSGLKFFIFIREVNDQIKVSSNGSDILIIFEFAQVYFFYNQPMVFKEKYALAAFECIDKAPHFHPIEHIWILVTKNLKTMNIYKNRLKRFVWFKHTISMRHLMLHLDASSAKKKFILNISGWSLYFVSILLF